MPSTGCQDARIKFHESLINVKCLNLTTSGFMLVVDAMYSTLQCLLPTEAKSPWTREGEGSILPSR